MVLTRILWDIKYKSRSRVEDYNIYYKDVDIDDFNIQRFDYLKLTDDLSGKVVDVSYMFLEPDDFNLIMKIIRIERIGVGMGDINDILSVLERFGFVKL